MDDKWGGHKPAAMRLAPAESGAGAGPLPARCWHGGGSDGSAGAGPLHSQFALSPPVRCRLRRGWPQLPEPARWWAASAMLSGGPTYHLHWTKCSVNSIRKVFLSCYYMIDHGREGVMATTHLCFVAPSCALRASRRRPTNHSGVVAVTPSRPWSIP